MISMLLGEDGKGSLSLCFGVLLATIRRALAMFRRRKQQRRGKRGKRTWMLGMPSLRLQIRGSGKQHNKHGSKTGLINMMGEGQEGLERRRSTQRRMERLW